MLEKLITRNWGLKERLYNINEYERLGGFLALKKVLSLSPKEVIEEVKRSNLRGRGGGAFPTGVKWSFLPQGQFPRYLVVNGDEGEPGTFKDHALIENDPFRLIEGCIIASYAIQAEHCFIYIRGELEEEAKLLEDCIKQAKDKGYLGRNCFGKKGFNLEISVFRGAGGYICGEETALLNSLEGERGVPRLKPPFPAIKGLFGYPTIINNVETISYLTVIFEIGGDSFAQLGVEDEGGTRLICLSGDIKRPGVYEIRVGTPLKDIIYNIGGGPKEGKKIKAVFPGGISSLPLTPEELKLPYSVSGLKQVGSMPGSGGIIVIGDDICMVWVALRLAKFFHHESCGQCVPCSIGTGWLEFILKKIEGGESSKGDIQLIENITDNIFGKTLCPFGDAASMPIKTILNKFREEFITHIVEKRCPYRVVV